MIFSTQPIKVDELPQLILFDKLHLIEAIKKMGIPANKCPPVFTLDELLEAYQRNDIMKWIFVDGALAGYLWREKREYCIFGSGAAIKEEYYGVGLSTYIITSTENMAKQARLTKCQMAIMPANGRVINAYMKHGYQIVDYIKNHSTHASPDRLRCIMEKNLEAPTNNKIIIDTIKVSCSNEDELKKLIDDGYRGVRLIRGDFSNTMENRIVFEKI